MIDKELAMLKVAIIYVLIFVCLQKKLVIAVDYMFIFVSRIRTRRTFLPRPFKYEDTSAQLNGNFVGIVNKKALLLSLYMKNFNYHC